MYHDTLHAEGRIFFSAFPASYDEAILRELCRMTLASRLREAVHVHEVGNIITLAGHAQIATILGTSGSTVPLTQYLGIGSTQIISVSGADTSVPGEFYRQLLSSSVIVGTQVDCQFSIAAGNGNGTYASVGIFGNGATGTLGTGTLYTHALANFTKTSANSLVVDYLLNIQ